MYMQFVAHRDFRKLYLRYKKNMDFLKNTFFSVKQNVDDNIHPCRINIANFEFNIYSMKKHLFTILFFPNFSSVILSTIKELILPYLQWIKKHFSIQVFNIKPKWQQNKNDIGDAEQWDEYTHSSSHLPVKSSSHLSVTVLSPK